MTQQTEVSGWQAWVCSLEGTCKNGVKLVKNAAICGWEPGTKCQVWAKSLDFGITSEELDELMRKKSTLAQHGAALNGHKCILVRDGMDDGLTLDLKDSTGQRHGICIAKSKKALLVVEGEDNVGSGSLCGPALDMAKSLCDAGY